LTFFPLIAATGGASILAILEAGGAAVAAFFEIQPISPIHTSGKAAAVPAIPIAFRSPCHRFMPEKEKAAPLPDRKGRQTDDGRGNSGR
jgi:hypothetical protein